eukprot:TRINITY_DN63245_c0_g1_i1.p2 TRINITY_DN63245_c0_g1~~TRINITY_DN63245_c0_g1_i1.p2  ORF type:complete len:165 (+),score=13.45 TRINITY_DN63245_c0_g1_i1:145-639(+)
MVKFILFSFTILLVASIVSGQLRIYLNSWQPVSDPTQSQQILQNIWNKLTSVPCWDSSFVGDPTAFGTPAGVSQFSFWGDGQWRYAGSMDTYWGTVRVNTAGRYQDQYGVSYDGVIMETWTGDQEGFIIGKGQYEGSFLHVTYNPSGALYDVFYYAVQYPYGCQ